jgi:chaperonin GroES
MKLNPTLDRVSIRRDDKEKKSPGGIILGSKAEKESNFGTVLAVGPGGWNQDGTRRAMSVKVGDKVFFTDYHMTETASKVVIVDEEDILAVVKG